MLFLGTDDGLYVSLDAGTSWQKWTKGFPTTSVKDLVIQPREHDLVIGTFGRAAWVLDDIRPLRAIAKDKSTLSRKLQLFQPPTAYQAAYQQPTGSRFGGDALYNAENRGRGAHISYYVTKQEKKKSKESDKKNEDKEDETDDSEVKKVTWDSIHLKIYDGDRQIRHLKWKTPDSTGIHKTRWFMNEAGGDRPSRTIRKRRNEPGGVGVKPGTYRLEMSYGDQMSASTITVASDPRLTVPQKAINDRYTAGKTLEGLTQTAADAVKQLVESKTIAEDYKKVLKKLDKDAHKEDLKTIGKMVKSIDKVIALYLGTVDKRQGITRNPEITAMQRIGLARRYAGSRPNGLTDTENLLIQQAKDELQSALDKTNTFFTDEWTPFQAKLEALDVKPFKEIKSFNMN